LCPAPQNVRDISILWRILLILLPVNPNAPNVFTFGVFCMRFCHRPSPPSTQSTRRHPCWCFFCVQCCFLALPHTPNTKPHQRGCGFVFGVFPLPYKACRTQKDTHVGVFSWLAAYFLHAEHTTTPHWCDFVFSVFSSSSYTCQTRNDTLFGVISCLDPFLLPRKNIEGCLLNILILLNNNIIYIFK
jgi:hypothetical protein